MTDIPSIAAAWATLEDQLAESRSPAARWLARVVRRPDVSEGDYLVALGHLVRCAAGAPIVRHGVRDAIRRLADPACRGAFAAALDVAVERCLEAVDDLRFRRGYAAERFIELVVAREEVEGLAAVARLSAITEPELGYLADLERSATRAGDEIDEVADLHAVVELFLESRTAFPPSHERLNGVATLHADEWWWAAFAQVGHRKLMRSAAAELPDDLAALVAWLPTLRQLDLRRAWHAPHELDDLNQQLVAWIDGSYLGARDRSAEYKALQETVHALAGTIRDALGPRDLPKNVRRQLARMITLAFTLFDRVRMRMNTGPGLRVPHDLTNLGWAASAWRHADPSCDEAAFVFDAFQQVFILRRMKSPAGEQPAGVIAGCTAVAAHYARIGYPDDAKVWLERASRMAKATPRALRAIGGVWVSLAHAYLRPPPQPEQSIAAAECALRAAVSARETARSSDDDLDGRIEGRALAVRALAKTVAGDAEGADRDRTEALAALDTVQPRYHERFWLMHERRKLLLRRGDIRAAADVMREFIEWCRASARHVVDRKEYLQHAGWAASAACSLGLMLLDRDNADEGAHWLREVARDKTAPPRWRDEAEALLRARDDETTLSKPRVRRHPRQDLTTREEEAQRAYRAARASTQAERPAAIARAHAANDKILRAKPTDRIARTRRAHLWILEGGDALNRAHADLNELGSDAPDDPYILFAKGRLALAQGTPDVAANLFRHAYELSPRAETATLLASALLKANRPDEAFHAASRHEHDATLIDLAGLALLAKGDSAGAWTQMVRAAALFVEDGDTGGASAFDTRRPPRVVALARRLAALAERVPIGQVVAFLQSSDPLITGPFVSACMADLRFSPALRTAIVDAGAAAPSLRRPAAQYAMAVAIHEETSRGRDSIVSWLTGAWERLQLADRPGLIAEVLAGAKGAYARSVRSALEGERRHTSALVRRWLEPISGTTSALARHVARAGYVESYYTTAEQLAAERVPWTVEGFIAEAQCIIQHARLSVLTELDLLRALEELAAAPSSATAWADAVGGVEGAPSLDTAGRLGLVSADDPIAGTVVFASQASIALAITSLGMPTSVRFDDEQTTLVATWSNTAWPEALRTACETDHLWLDHGALAVPIVARAS